jgi:hypothetical protein
MAVPGDAGPTGAFFIEFLADQPGSAALQGRRLASMHGFLNFTAFLAMILAQLDRSDNQRAREACRRCREYAAGLTWADSLFERFDEEAGRRGSRLIDHLRCWGSDVDWLIVALAKRVAAALVLHGEPISASEAGQIRAFLAPVEQEAWRGACHMGWGEEVPDSNVAWMAEVTRDFVRCLEVVVKTGCPFRVVFRPAQGS